MSQTNWQYPFSLSKDDQIDLSSLDAFNEGAPFETFARMRAQDSLTWCDEVDGRGFWSVTKHKDIQKLNKDFALLTSSKGIRIEDQTEEEYEARKTFQETDPPEHTKTRLIMHKAFGHAQIAQYEEQIRNITVELVEKGLKLGEFDAVEEVAAQLPMRMLGGILGVPDEDLEWLVKKGDSLISNSDPDYTDFVVDKVDTEEYRMLPFRSPAAIELFDYADKLIERKRNGEAVGIVNLILEPDKDGNVISDDEFKNFFCLLVAAGNDTTRYSLTACMHALANHPTLMQQLKDNIGNKDFFLSATDELIRWASPTTHFRRTATDDFEYKGKQVKKGDKVVLWFLSANRDEEIFGNPYEIDLLRKPNRFLSFGQGGPHVCLGMFLAKLEVRVVLEELANRVSKIEQVGLHSYLRSNFILGIKKLPVKFVK
ncbi:cytochrome P450 [Paraglaciecola arctica]|uniref:Cytochrome P450 family protein n=1 Tax=Paraglaciecola arctica BSs20135 TaxID=493475 RepID=K6YCH8_9ALTE|nr:cytochrome P450 [Paraglaciecola arctica]GAC21661.1 cytochrome P450 family protein [Paraglaciecola arctica BSs20135]